LIIFGQAITFLPTFNCLRKINVLHEGIITDIQTREGAVCPESTKID